MVVSDVTWDVADLVRDYIDSNWGSLAGSSGPSKPAHIELRTEDENGNARRGVDYTEEYILVVETGDREQVPVDGPRDVVDLQASCQMEVSTPQSRARREALYTEMLVLWEGARKEAATPGTPGGWDTADLDAYTVDDEVFNWWTFEGTWTFRAEARTL